MKTAAVARGGGGGACSIESSLGEGGTVRLLLHSYVPSCGAAAVATKKRNFVFIKTYFVFYFTDMRFETTGRGGARHAVEARNAPSEALTCPSEDIPW